MQGFLEDELPTSTAFACIPGLDKQSSPGPLLQGTELEPPGQGHQ